MYKIEKTFTSETKPGLKLNFNSENTGIRIKGGEQENSVLDLSIEYTTKKKQELDVKDFLNLEYNSDKNEMTINFKQPEGMRIFKSKIELTVPETTQVYAKTENGPLGLTGLNGDQQIITENGPLALIKIKGNVNFESENGPLDAKDVQGDIVIKVENSALSIRESSGNCKIISENGIIKIKDSSGDLNIENENGQIRILKSSYRSAEIKNQNGGIYYEFKPLEEGVFNFINQNGKIRLIIPEEIQYNMTALNGIGKINIGIDGNYDKQKVNGKTEIHMVKESGRVKINATNQNGSISISRSGEKERANFSFNFNGFAGTFDDIMSSIPEKDKEKVKIKLEKVKKKIADIDFDKLEKKIDSAAQNFEKAVEKEFDSEKTTEIMEKLKTGLNKAMEKLNSKFNEADENAEKNSKDEESKLMILKMLQDGKITSEEAEKLLKAIGE